MSAIDIRLPAKFKPFLKKEAARRGYKDEHAFVEALIEAEQLRNVSNEVEAMLLEAVDGPFEDWTDKDVDDIRRVGTKIIERRRQRKTR